MVIFMIIMIIYYNDYDDLYDDVLAIIALKSDDASEVLHG